MKERRLLALATGEDSFDCEGGIESISRVVAAGERRLPGTGSEAIGQVFKGLLGTGFEGFYIRGFRLPIRYVITSGSPSYQRIALEGRECIGNGDAGRYGLGEVGSPA